MRIWRWLAVVLLVLGPWGCAQDFLGPAPLLSTSALTAPENPILVANVDRDLLWDQLVDVVDDYFQIDREDRVRQVGDVLTEGRIDTFPQIGATLLEPWLGDSVGISQRTESTLQSIRRQSIVRVLPTGQGYLVDVAVFKELEDVLRPDYSNTGAATFNQPRVGLTHDTDVVLGSRPNNVGWIPVGRDILLEQRIISDLRARIAGPMAPVPSIAPGQNRPIGITPFF